MSEMNILEIDIETAPNTAHVWGLFNQNIGINQIQQTGRVMCWAAKWYGQKPVEFMSEYHDDHAATIKRAHELLDEADAVMSYNGKRFDMPTLNREFLKYGLRPPSPYHHIDLLEVMKSQFRFTSNKLDHVLRELGIGEKVKHEGHELWTKCMAGDPKAWAKMKRYNIGDVRGLEVLYEALKPWIRTHPNHAMYTDENRPVCTNCGGTHLQARGMQTTRTQKYQRYQCQDCGTWMRSRYTETSLAKRKATYIQT
jgi:DNA-directed RNA polymerase subunit RPC12/RpoP